MFEYYGQKRASITIDGKTVLGREVLLPMPVSENARLAVDYKAVKNMCFGTDFSNSRKSRKGIFHNSTAYNRWKSAAIHHLKKGKFEKLEGDVAIFITLIFPNKTTRDADNRIKGLFDALTQSECVFEDDKQVSLFTVDKQFVKNKNFVLAYIVKRDDLENVLTFTMSESTVGEKAKIVEDYVVAKRTTKKQPTSRSDTSNVGNMARQRFETARLSKS